MYGLTKQDITNVRIFIMSFVTSTNKQFHRNYV